MTGSDSPVRALWSTERWTSASSPSPGALSMWKRTRPAWRERPRQWSAGERRGRREGVGRDDVARAEEDDIGGNELAGVRLPHAAVAEEAAALGEGGLESGDGGFGPGLTEVADGGVEEKEGGDEEEVDPLAEDGGEDGGGLDEVGDGVAEVGEKGAPPATADGRERVGAEDGAEALGFGFGEADAGVDGLEGGQVDAAPVHVDGVRGGRGRRGRR